MQSKLLIALLALSSSVAFAAPETYVTDANHTFANFTYSHFGYSNQTSRFDKVSGTITLDSAAKSGNVDITIDTKSINTGSTLFNQHIQGDDFLATEKFPTATFKGNKVSFKGDKLASVQGELTLKGITKPVTLQVTNFFCMQHPMSGKQACGANATVQVKRTDFNMGKYAPHVGDEVTIAVAVEATKQ
jgi:polyisoprenoid-binding protein YceI